MQTKYYVIPTIHEALLTTFQTVWLQSSLNSYMITTGFYTVKEVPISGVSLKTTVKDQALRLIPKDYYFLDDESLKQYKANLEFFVLEAKPSDMPLNLPSDILVFDTNLKYLEYARNYPNKN